MKRSMLVLAGALLVACASGAPAAPEGAAGAPPATIAAASEAERAPGLSVASLHPTAGGRMLDLRLRVDDAERAEAALSRDTAPVLIVERSGQRVSVPQAGKVGSLRQTTREPTVGRVYFALFSNPGLREGDEVTLELGDVTIRHVRVGAGG